MASESKDTLWEFNCPQFVDFDAVTEDNADSYFDTDHENGEKIYDIQNDFLKSPNLKKTVKPDSEGKTGNFHRTPGGSQAKRNPLAVIQTKVGNNQKDYEFRLTPYRQGKSESYCSAYMAGSGEAVKSTSTQMKGEKGNIYNLRMTPARKRKTKSCFMFRDVGLTGGAKDVALSDSVYIDSPKTESVLPENEYYQRDVDSKEVSPNSSTGNIKRAGSPIVEAFPVKRAKLNVANIWNPKKKQLSDQSKKSKTSEERELMKIKQLRCELALKRAKNEKYMRKAINAEFTRGASESTMSQHTVVKPFHFKTDERIKDMRPAEGYKPVDFSSILRRQSPRVTKSKPELTKLQPFHFATDKRLGQHGPEVEKVDNKGPKKKTTMGLSLPQSPNLRTVKRNRPVTALSRQQVEDLEVKEMKQYKFHAKDFDPTSFCKVVLPKVYTKPSTKPEAMHLATEKRFKNKETKKPEDEKKFEFHAQPVPKQILTAPTGLKPKPMIPQTEPRSPAFALKLRSQKWKEISSASVEPDEPQVITFKAHPVPTFKAPAPVKNTKKCTVVEPFSFDQKDQERAHLKEQRVTEEIEKQKRAYNFRAQPLPDLTSISGIPKKETKPATKPQPFQLQIDKLAEQKVDKWVKEVASQLVQERAAAVFKANPSIVTKRPPFQPEKSARPLTVSNNIQLQTEKRAEERMKFEEHLQYIDAENKAYHLHMKEEKERQEKEEIASLRRQTVHKANPVRHYKSVEIKPSDKPLTQASSPCFATNLRAKERV